MQLKSIYDKNLGFIEQKNVFLNTTERFKQEKGYLIDIIFAMIIFLLTFSKVPSISLC